MMFKSQDPAEFPLWSTLSLAGRTAQCLIYKHGGLIDKVKATTKAASAVAFAAELIHSSSMPIAHTPTMSNILVLGAGELGTPILDSLIAMRTPDIKISLVVRPTTLADPETGHTTLARRLEAAGVARIGVNFDHSSVDDLARVFVQYDTVISASGMAASPGTQLKLAKAVLKAKVKRYVPWQFGLDYDAIGKGKAQDLFDEQLDVRALLQGQQQTEWVIISTGIFMTFLFEDTFGVVEGMKDDSKNVIVRGLGSWDNRVTYTHPVDIGNLTAAVVLKSWAQEKNDVVFVAGDTVSFNELAAAIKSAVGRRRQMSTELWDLDYLKDDLRSQPDDGMKKYRVVLAEGVGVAWDKSETWNTLNRIAVKTVHDFAVQMASPA